MKLSQAWNLHRFRCYLYILSEIVKRMNYDEFNFSIQKAVKRYKDNGLAPPERLNEWRLEVAELDLRCVVFSYHFFGEVIKLKENFSTRQLESEKNKEIMQQKFRYHSRDFVTVVSLSDLPSTIREITNDLKNRFFRSGKLMETMCNSSEELQRWVITPKKHKYTIMD